MHADLLPLLTLLYFDFASIKILMMTGNFGLTADGSAGPIYMLLITLRVINTRLQFKADHVHSQIKLPYNCLTFIYVHYMSKVTYMSEAN